jgi:predicted negative regulator of RcsB-dependent stress response
MTKTGEAATPRLDLKDEESILEALDRHKRPLTIGVIVLALVLSGGWMMRRSAQIRESRASAALGVGENAYTTGSTAVAMTEFARVSTRYAGTSAGTQASLMLAQLHFEAGQVDSAMTVLEAALKKSPKHLRAGVLAHQAAGLALGEKHAEAAGAYLEAAKFAQFRQEADQFRMDAARQHVLASEIEAARAIYTEIARREDSSSAVEARLRLGELTLRT